MAGQEWSTYEMKRDGEFLKWSADVAAARDGQVVEFVITDGQGDWDKAPDGGNYFISETGTFELRDGTLAKVGKQVAA